MNTWTIPNQRPVFRPSKVETKKNMYVSLCLPLILAAASIPVYIMLLLKLIAAFQ
ncbi:MAG: hypothetical protein JST52_04820 [Bacteroidetes bacterium]|nr:hypothetical protein [Bacteroidota bacterium]MBS1740574.1 hypothetical protein [Bacteroidota bacterium]MBS1776091.1 hypothetical protein [Bacteroidota bacterium]